MSRYLFVFCLFVLQGSLLYKAGTPVVAALGFSLFAYLIALLFLLLNVAHQSWKQFADPLIAVQSPFMYLLCFQAWVFVQYASGISLDPDATFRIFLIGTGFLVFVYCLSALTGSEYRHQWLFVSMATMAVMQALYGIYNVISGDNLILWYPKEHYLDKATGTFVNPNHFAAYLNLCIGLLLGFFISKSTSQPVMKQQRFVLRWLSRLYSLEILVLLVLIIGVLFSKSIGAIASLVTALLLTPFVLAVLKKRHLKQVVLMVLLPIITVAFCLLFVDYSVFLDEKILLSHTIERRLELSAASLSLAKDYWFTGSGGGTFFAVFPEYRNIEIGHAFYYHAHNDYLEFLSDYGVVGLIFLVLFVLMALKKNIAVIFDGSQYQKVFAYASVFSTMTIAVHSLVDFPLQVTAFALTYLCIITVNCLVTPS